MSAATSIHTQGIVLFFLILLWSYKLTILFILFCIDHIPSILLGGITDFLWVCHLTSQSWKRLSFFVVQNNPLCHFCPSGPLPWHWLSAVGLVELSASCWVTAQWFSFTNLWKENWFEGAKSKIVAHKWWALLWVPVCSSCCLLLLWPFSLLFFQLQHPFQHCCTGREKCRCQFYRILLGRSIERDTAFSLHTA